MRSKHQLGWVVAGLVVLSLAEVPARATITHEVVVPIDAVDLTFTVSNNLAIFNAVGSYEVPQLDGSLFNVVDVDLSIDAAAGSLEWFVPSPAWPDETYRFQSEVGFAVSRSTSSAFNQATNIFFDFASRPFSDIPAFVYLVPRDEFETPSNLVGGPSHYTGTGTTTVDFGQLVRTNAFQALGGNRPPNRFLFIANYGLRVTYTIEVLQPGAEALLPTLPEEEDLELILIPDNVNPDEIPDDLLALLPPDVQAAIPEPASTTLTAVAALSLLLMRYPRGLPRGDQ